VGSNIEIIWNDRLVGHFRCAWECCRAVATAREEALEAFAEADGEFLPERGVVAGPAWYHGVCVDGQWVPGSFLSARCVDPIP
jgi:hypothetical protein